MRALASALPRLSGAWLGLFTLINLVGDRLRPGFDANRLWIALPGVPREPGQAFLLLVGLALIAHAWRPIQTRLLRVAAAAAVGLAALAALVDAARFYGVLLDGSIVTPAVLPASLAIALFLGALCRQIARGRERSSRVRLQAFAFVLLAPCAVGALPLLLMVTFGPTDYARRADCAAVFGAKVYADGEISLALADRVDEGIRLYRRGLVRALILSGGIDPGNGLSEPAAMRDRAVAAGVPPEAIVLDEEGVDTFASVRNAARLMRAHGWSSVLAVSHYYHLPRIHMLFGRAGVRAYTVPARMTRRLVREPYFIAREVAAFYHAYLFQVPPREGERAVLRAVAALSRPAA